MHRGDERPGPEYDGARRLPTVYHARVPARGDQLTALRRTLTSWARRHGFPSNAVQAIELACYEAMANVVKHAYAGSDGELRLSATAHPDRLDVAVYDRGRWHGPRDHPNGGMGITLIQRLADHAEIDTGDGGTVVSMTWFRSGTRNHG